MGATWDNCQKVLRGLKRLQELINWPEASDDTPVFPQNKVLAFFEEGNKIGLLGQCSCKENAGCLSARGFTDTEVSQIRESFTSVLAFLVYVGRANRIFDFIKSDSTDQRVSERPLEDSELRSLISEDAKVIEDYEIWEIRKIHHQFFLPNLRHKSEHYDFDRTRSLPIKELEQLGDGGFSHVYRARILDGYHDFGEVEHVEDGQVAIKSFKGQKDYGKRFCRRERRHNELWKSHCYIIPLLASLNRGGHYMIIFPLASHDLKQLMGKTLPLEYLDGRKAWFQFANLLSALRYVHTSNGRKGYHFDLKPQNILVRSNGDWALTDFGISHSKEDCFTSATGMDGSRGEYSPPEKVRVRRSFDIWSMGCIGCEIVEWLYNGPQGVDKFRSDRGGKSFSYRNRLRMAVIDVLNSASTRDLLTRGVATCLYNMLKIVPLERVTAEEAEISIREVLGIPDKDDSGTLSRVYKLTSTYAEDQKEMERLQLSVMKRRMIMLGESHPDTLTSMNLLASTYKCQGQFAEAEKLQTCVREKHQALFGENHPETLTSSHQLASIYESLGQFAEARRLQECVVGKRKDILGENDLDTLTSMNLLASIYRRHGLFAEAERLQDYVVESRKITLGEDHLETLASKHQLAWIYIDRGRYVEARKLQEYVVGKRKSILGKDDLETMASMNLLALIYTSDNNVLVPTYLQYQGKLKEAAETQDYTVKRYKEKLGEDHPDTLCAMQGLANTYWRLERFAEAERLCLDVMEKRRIVLGKDHPDTLATMQGLATTYWSLDRFAEAEFLEKYVVEKRKVVLGEDHPDTLGTIQELATTYWRLERFAEAEGLYQYVAEKRPVVLGEDHPDTLVTMHDLVATYWSMGRFTEAKILGQSTMERRKVVLGEGHPDTLATMQELAAAYWNLGQFKEAAVLERYVHVAGKMEIGLGKGHSDALVTMHDLATTYWTLGQFGEAELLEKYVMEKRKVVLGENHPDTLDIMHDLATAYWSMERFAEAERLGRYTMEKRKVVLGEDHPDTLATMHNLAAAYWSLGQFGEAEALEKYVVERRKIALGEGHPDTLDTMHNLATTYRSMELFAEAERLCRYTMEKSKVVLGEEHPDALNNKLLLDEIREDIAKGFIEAEGEMDTGG